MSIYSPNCDCTLQFDYEVRGNVIVYCPRHKAAPELFEALKELVSVPNKKRPDRVWDEARTAIAKAEGGK